MCGQGNTSRKYFGRVLSFFLKQYSRPEKMKPRFFVFLWRTDWRWKLNSKVRFSRDFTTWKIFHFFKFHFISVHSAYSILRFWCPAGIFRIIFVFLIESILTLLIQQNGATNTRGTKSHKINGLSRGIRS